jgi:hypothetical protein
VRKRVQIALAISLVAVAGVVAWRILHSQEDEPIYQGKGLQVWLREYSGWDVGPEEWAKAKTKAEHAVQEIGTNAIPNLLEMVRKTESPRMLIVIDFWDGHIANRSYLPAWVQHPAWYKNRARYRNMEGEIGFKILGADAQQAVPELMSIYERTLSMESIANMNSQIAASGALVDIGPAAIAPLLQWATGTNEEQRLGAIHVLSQIHAQPSAVVPVLVKFLSHTNFQVRIQVADGLGEFGEEARQAVPALILSLSDRMGTVRVSAANALKQIDPEAAARAGVK